MKTHRTIDTISLELTLAEARVLLDELSDVRGGARLPKVRQVCAELEDTFALETVRKNSASGRKH